MRNVGAPRQGVRVLGKAVVWTVALYLVALLPTRAEAQAQYRTSAGDGVYVATAVGLSVLLGFDHTSARPGETWASRADDLLSLDRASLGFPRPRGARLSDLMVTTLMAGAVLGPTLDRARDDVGAAFSEDAVVSLASLSSVLLATQLLKVMMKRPRPYVYLDPSRAADADALRSFPSGHTSMAFGAAATLTRMTWNRHGTGAALIAVGATTFVAATLVGGLRVWAQRHFWTDVFAGALLGTAIGWAVPLLYRADPSPAGVRPQMLISLGGAW